MEQPKTVLVTGATGAIGKAIAYKIASLNHHLVLIGRSEIKVRNTVDEISRLTGNTNVMYELADLSRHSEISALASRWNKPLHVMINNAAVTPRSRMETPEGIELQFATNVLGYFHMTNNFMDILKTSAPARIVDVASYWAGGLDLSDLEFVRRRYSNGAAYRQSKQANRMLVAAWSNLLAPYEITINACHPGDVNSKLSNNLGFGGSQTPDQGADTPFWLATSPENAQVTGKYFESCREVSCPFSNNREAVNALFEACQSYGNVQK
jgi:NAD(P)-dependent dehydrogenase (short-subunit alcohol dehydrogenase family)